MDKPNASVPWASSQVLVGSHLHIVPELLRCLFLGAVELYLHFPESCGGN